MGFLPQLGTTYSSMAALKLDVLERALPRELNFGTYKSITDDLIDFRCSARTRSDTYCSCRVYAKKMESGLFKVLGIDEVHTCRGKNRHDLSRPRLHPAKKIHKLKDEVSEEEQKRMKLQREREREQRGRKSHEGVLSDGSEEENSVMVESTYDRRQPMSKASWKSRTRSGYLYLEEEDENENSSETGSEARISTTPTWKETLHLWKEAKDIRGRTTSGLRQYPRADEVQAEIQEFLSNGIVSFPAFEDRFTTSWELLVRLYAHAQQRGFSVHRRSGSDLTNQFWVSCNRSYNSYKNKIGGTCPFKVIAKEGNDGTWRITHVEAHNHEIKEPSIEQIQVSQAGSQHLNGSSLTPPRKRPRRNSSPPPFPSASSASIEPLPLQDNFLTPALPLRLLSNTNRSHSLSKSTKSTFDSTSLFFLVQSFSPTRTQASTFLASLTAVGISDVETLSSILKLETTNFRRFLSGIEGKETRDLIEEMAKELRQ
ncbi:hypothetical protein JCM5350_003729 [Sporobolomyces pararoseus]